MKRRIVNLLRAMRDDLGVDRPSAIVDVGSNPFGEPPYQTMIEAEAAHVTGFEPNPAAFERLKERFSDTERHLPYAVGDGTTGTLNVCKDSGFSSLLKPNFKTTAFLGQWTESMQVVEEMPVDTRRLDDMAEIANIDLLKIDIQGAELQVFQNGREKLRDAVMVISETAFIPIYEDQPLIGDQMEEMRSQGFMLHRFLPWRAHRIKRPGFQALKRRPNAVQLTDIDAVFIKDMTAPKKLIDDQLKQLALLSAGVLQSFELAVAALWELEQRSAIDDTCRARVLKTAEIVQR